LILYNCGNVDSAAALAFLGAKERRASTYATFTLHRCAMSIAYAQPAARMKEYVEAMLIQDGMAESIYRQVGLKLTAAHWDKLADNDNLTFSAKEAMEIGLVQQIEEFRPPSGSVLFPL
jgi:ATP-dependent protease ClpP protease subunit